MSLFGIGKKKETCSCGCSSGETAETKNTCRNEAKDSICCIKVLGAGCASCHTQYENVKKAVKNMGLDIEVEYITDMKRVMEYGVMSMPAIVVNENVVSAGKVLKAAEVEKLLKEA